MNRYTSLASMVLLFTTQLNAACIYVDNQDLVEYTCEGGSIYDINLLPNNVEKIRISNMSIGRVDKDIFSRFDSNLLVLTCSHCMITDIDDDAFHRLRNLQQLSFDNNYLKEVKANWFKDLAYLTYLDLNYNNIERIDKDIFLNAPNIVDLRLSGNRLVCLDLESLSKLNDLKRIFLNDNPNFGCSNAMKKFLNERHIDYEADVHWSTSVIDQMSTEKQFSQIPPIFKNSKTNFTQSITSSTILKLPSSSIKSTTSRTFLSTSTPQDNLIYQK
jgi:Leucine-rich repeat (LRR) protein